MKFDLSLALNLFSLGLAAGCNCIYPCHVTAVITYFNLINILLT